MTQTTTTPKPGAPKSNSKTDTKTTDTKTAPAQKKDDAPALDFSTLTVTTAEAPQRTGGGRRATVNPMMTHMQDSWNARKEWGNRKDENGTPYTVYLGEGREVTVPKANVQQVLNLIRMAANKLNLGSVTQEEDVPGGKVRISFAAKTRKRNKKVVKVAAPAPTETTPQK